jgi:hypothetical protein
MQRLLRRADWDVNGVRDDVPGTTVGPRRSLVSSLNRKASFHSPASSRTR